MTPSKKLIEVALPLKAINEASAREKSIRHGHPSTLHLWWARRPLAAARAVIFAQMVDDPSTYCDELLANDAVRAAALRELDVRRELWAQQVAQYEEAQRSGDTAIQEPGPEPTLEECAADLERDRLFRLIEELVKWENTTNEELLKMARAEIRRSWRRTCRDNRDHPRAAELFDPERLPAFHDPFAGGGALPLEAQRLGLESYASDLNPVAVLICKAMIEIPPKFESRPPVNPEARSKENLFDREWKGAEGLAEDVRYYGEWMRARAEERIGRLYPKVKITPEMVKERPDLKKYEGRELTVIAWLWARTVRSPNPPFSHVHVPLVSDFMVSTRKGKEAYVEPTVDGDQYRFQVRKGKPEHVKESREGTKLGRGANFRCLVSGAPIDGNYIKAEGQAGRMSARLIAIVLEGDRERVYVSPTADHDRVAQGARPSWQPGGDVPPRLTGGTCVPYGLREWGDLFTRRQLLALTTFSDLVQEARKQILADATVAGSTAGSAALAVGSGGAAEYADALIVYLGSGVSRLANRMSTICIWNRPGQKIEQVFRRQAIPMTWDFAEGNPFSDSTGGWTGSVAWIPKAMRRFPGGTFGEASCANVSQQTISRSKIVATDPPYYDNIGYADLSDFFYVWLRHMLKPAFPSLFGTLASPKSEELIAASYRHESRAHAEAFFLSGMTKAMECLSEQAHGAFPITMYYAFKQAEGGRTAPETRTGWETFLDAAIGAGLGITGTWPIRTERDFGVKTGSNVLASSVVLVCRPRHPTAPMATRREFLSHLKRELPAAISNLQRGNVAPVDLAQAAIGPGMAIFTRFSSVKESDGSDMSVRTALQLINQVLDETLAEQESDFDPDTRWALAWFTEFGVEEGPYGRAETLSTAKNTSVSGMVDAGILSAGRGKVRLLSRDELDPEWDPRADPRLTIWEVTQHLIRALKTGGETEAASLLGQLGGGIGETARELAYRLYALCERKKWAQEAIAYNTLVTAWPEISRLARETTGPEPEQIEAF